MTSASSPRHARLVRLLASLALIAPWTMPPAAAQTTAYPALADADPVTALSRYLRMLAANPRDLASLTGAGRAALAVGDANAALGFYARAEELAPRNGRIKAGLATALVQMEQPRAALKLFGEAVALGVPEGEIAADRGLANDLIGDGRRAQADYTIALRAHDEDETVRRLALSMAVSGDRDGAMAILSPLLRRRDSGAERARAFVLALTGDQAGAASAVRAAIPGPQATVMTSFMARLARLNPAQKALAVNFGYFPSDGRSYTAAELFADARAAPLPSSAGAIGQRDPRGDLRGDTPLIPAGEALGPRIVRGDDVSNAPRRRPGEIVEVLPPAHVLSAPIPGMTPPTAAMGAAEARVALAQSAPRPIASFPVARQASVIAAPMRDPVATTSPATAATAPVAVAGTMPVATVTLPPATLSPPAGAVPAPGFDMIATGAAAGSRPVVEEAVVSRRPVTAAFPGNAPVIVAAAGPTPAGAPHHGTAHHAMNPPIPAVVTKPVATTTRTSTRTERSARTDAGRDDDAVETPATVKTGRSARNGKVVKLAVLDPGEGRSAADGGNRTMKTRRQAGETKDGTSGKAAAGGRSDGTGRNRKGAATTKGSKAADTVDDDDGKGVKAGRNGKAAAGGRESRSARATDDAKTGRRADAKTGKREKSGKGGRTPDDPKARDAKAAPATPERYWVQVASGANKANLDKAWDAVKGKAPRLLAGQQTHTAPWHASNRLLIGPFKDEAAAQAKVNALAKAGVSGIQFTTRAGADVEKVETK